MENENFLADWLDGKMSDDELRKLVSAADFDAYQKLRITIERYQIAEPSIDDNYRAVKQKLSRPKKDRAVRPLFYYLAAAAMIAVIFGLFQLFSYTQSAETGAVESITHMLADNSTVTLNAKSRIEYSHLFRYNRSLRLSGEAFFEVVKGSTFTVNTEAGKIRVIGTKFNVISREGWFEVGCFEGSVEVTSASRRTILEKGNSLRIVSGQFEQFHVQSIQPSWMSGERRYENLPFHIVIDELERQYNQEISYPGKLRNIRFTGTLTNTNLGTALESLRIPLNLKYHETGSGEISISE